MSRAVFEFPGTLSPTEWTQLEGEVYAYMAGRGHDMVAIQKAEAQLECFGSGTFSTFTRVALCTSTEWSGVSGVLDILCQLVQEDAVVQYWHGKL